MGGVERRSAIQTVSGKKERKKEKVTASLRQKRERASARENKPCRDGVESQKLCALIQQRQLQQRQQQQQQLVSCLVRSSRAECHHDANNRRARERVSLAQRAIEPMAVNKRSEIITSQDDNVRKRKKRALKKKKKRKRPDRVYIRVCMRARATPVKRRGSEGARFACLL